MVSMHSEMSSHSGHRDDNCMHTAPVDWGGPEIKWLQ